MIAPFHVEAAVRIFILLAISLAPVLQAELPPLRHPYVQHWKKSAFGKSHAAGVAARAAVRQLRKSPEKWGGGAAGFGKRLGAGFATHAVKTTAEHLIAAPLHEDLQYHRSEKAGVGPRLKHALASTVVTRNLKTGKRKPAAGRIGGHAAAGAVSQALLVGAGGATTAGLGLAAEAGANVAREFWPRK
ncbi:MAG TPA: hypothetical protein VL285_16110 [Bryobacteraceae bacterium]|jgi:hypothetical protein|nr:hypothetical protein [Bryobacteraceae bacterium]